jgi:hypothetical protein
MLVIRVSLWAGMAALYLGFAGVMGILIRRARLPSASPFDRSLAAVHAALLFGPASALVVSVPEWPMGLRALILAGGLLTTLLAAAQPRWTPKTLWRRPFGQRYFAAVMALAALWEIGLAISSRTLAPTVMGTAAGVAGTASFLSTLRRA